MKVHFLHQIGCDGETAFVIEAPIGHFSPMDLGLDHGDHHKVPFEGVAEDSLQNVFSRNREKGQKNQIPVPGVNRQS